MDKKEKLFKSLVLSIASMGVGAGAMYLANYKQLDFMSRYPVLVEIDDYVRDELEIEPPQNPDSAAVADAYFRLFDDKYTFIEEGVSPHSPEYGIENVNNSAAAKQGGFKIKFNEQKQPVFSAVVEGMSADEQGIKVGDVVKRVDDYELTDYNQAIRLIGKNGTTVKLLIERDGKEMTIDFTRRYEEERGTDIFESQMYGDVLYVSIETMDGAVCESFETALSENEFNSLVVDLRNNVGGFTDMAISIADMLTKNGSATLFYHNGEEQVYTTDDKTLCDVPIVVLINDATASAAEILTALLKQYADTTLVGVNTFGKGIFQSRALFKGESVRYTDGYYTVGDWENYHGKGIKPDVEIDMDVDYIGTDKDVQLEKALELLK